MNCPDFSPDLVAYHFGVVSEPTRHELERHLLACRECVADFLALKRQIETAETAERPSPAARDRLRRAVAQQLGVAPEQRPWGWWERPLAVTVAAAAVMAAMFVVQVVAAGEGSAPRTLSLQPAPTTNVPQQRR